MDKQLIKKPAEAALFEQLIAMACPPKPRRRWVQLAKKCGADIPDCPSPQSTDRNVCATFLEELVDACVLAASEAQIIFRENRAKPGSLYFTEEAAEKDLLFMDKVSELLNVDATPPSRSADQAGSFGAQRDEGVASTTSSIGQFVLTANTLELRPAALRNVGQASRLPVSESKRDACATFLAGFIR